MRLRRLRAAAEPTQGPNGPEPELDTQLISTSPGAKVKQSIELLQYLFDISKYQDPLHTLLDYLITVSILDLHHVFIMSARPILTKVV
jgi:hypothetical protein